MIRTRLAVAFALVALLALAQCLFAWWAASTAAYHAERSVVATRMLAEYLELAGNKQRLKVWFAERMLTGAADAALRDRLIGAMWASVGELRQLAEQRPADVAATEGEDLAAVALNIATLERAVRDAGSAEGGLPPSEQWRDVMLAFDELSGRDMRGLLRSAIERHEAASLRESALLAEALETTRLANAALAAVVLVFAVFAVVYFVRRLDHPFARLARLTEALGAGDFKARSGLVGHDEFARIGGLLDAMAGHLEEAQARSSALQQQLDDLVAERTRALTQAHESLLGIESRRRQFFAELSHELRTPVTVIRGEAELALRNPGDAGEQREALRRIVDAAGELGGRVQHLLDAARGHALDYAVHLHPGSLVAIVAAAVRQMQAVASHRGVTLVLQPTPIDGADVEVDRERLQQALVIVLDNAVRYSGTAGRVSVSLVAEDEHWVVQVDDDGPGMADDELEQAFDPHFRGRSGRDLDPQGLGLGLAIARRLVEAQRGSIDLQQRPSGGLRAVVALPKRPIHGRVDA